MPSYDAAHYDPPAPIAFVMLRNSHTGTRVGDVPLLLDTGADITLLPRATVEHLEVPVQTGQRYELMGFERKQKSCARCDAGPHFSGGELSEAGIC